MASNKSVEGAPARPGTATVSNRAPLICLVVLLVASEVLYLALVRLNAVNGLEPVLRFLGLMGALFCLYGAAASVIRDPRLNSSVGLGIVATGAVLFRLTLLPAGLPHDLGCAELVSNLRADVRGGAVAYERFQLFDSDVWRFLWDGHVWAHGENPYRYAPADPAVDPYADEENPKLTDGLRVWSDIRGNVNYSEMATLYPPLAQVVFRLSHWIAPGSVLAMKALVVGFDLLAAGFIGLTLGVLGRPRTDVLLYAWNPLVVKVFAASGHVDALVVAALAATAYYLACGARARAALSYGMAVLAKLSPLILLPFVARRVGRRITALACVVILAGYIPFFAAGRKVFDGLLIFMRQWQFNAGPFRAIQWLAGGISSEPASLARAISAAVIIAAVGWQARRDDGDQETFARYGVMALGALVILSPVLMPWYAVWLLPFAVIADKRVWIYFSAVVCLAFVVMVDQSEHSWTLGLEFGVLGLLVGFEFLPKRWAAFASAAGSNAPRSPRFGSQEEGKALRRVEQG